jgi:hypothetical protein
VEWSFKESVSAEKGIPPYARIFSARELKGYMNSKKLQENDYEKEGSMRNYKKTKNGYYGIKAHIFLLLETGFTFNLKRRFFILFKGLFLIF